MVEALKSKLLTKIDFIDHGFFSRNGGVSTGVYSSLNLRSSSNDNPENIKQNRQKIADYFNIPYENLIFLNQKHHNQANIVQNIAVQRFEGDGLVTSTSKIGLCIITADCVPVIFADSKNKIIGACHAGWKGALSGIIENTVAKMVKIGADRQHIVAAVGGAISVDSYEVGKKFFDDFLAKDKNSLEFFKNVKKKQHFDLKSYVANKIKQSHITNIEVLKNDTFLEENAFFSFRRSCHRQEPDYGCQATVIIIK